MFPLQLVPSKAGPKLNAASKENTRNTRESTRECTRERALERAGQREHHKREQGVVPLQVVLQQNRFQAKSSLYRLLLLYTGGQVYLILQSQTNSADDSRPSWQPKHGKSCECCPSHSLFKGHFESWDCCFQLSLSLSLSTDKRILGLGWDARGDSSICQMFIYCIDWLKPRPEQFGTMRKLGWVGISPRGGARFQLNEVNGQLNKKRKVRLSGL